MDSLAWDLRRLMRHAREGSRATQAARQARLSQIASDLRAEGFRGLRARGLKPKHVERLIERWAREGLSEGTIKNRMSDLRWWAHRVGRDGVVALERPLRDRPARLCRKRCRQGALPR